MKLAVTGTKGRMGLTLVSTWADVHELVLLDKDTGCDLSGAGRIDAVIHLAVDFDDADASSSMLEDALTTADTARFIYASSLTVDPHAAVDGEAAYVRAKILGERRCGDWVASHPTRRAVVLRFGHFDPGSHPPHQHEAVRLTEAGLVYWVERALGNEPTTGVLTVWTAMGVGGSRAAVRPAA